MSLQDPLNGQRWRVLTGDCLELLRSLPDGCVDAVVTDPPFGMNWDTDAKRFTGGKMGKHKPSPRPVLNDDKPFCPAPWLDFPKVILWGSNHYAQRLPLGTTLVWVKKPSNKLGKVLSDGEVGWQKSGHGVYVFEHDWDGCNRQTERGEHFHPTQKPIALMQWLIGRLNLPKGSLVLDPFCGSGSTGVACAREGMRFLGMELSEDYATIARRRIADAYAQGKFDFFSEEP